MFRKREEISPAAPPAPAERVTSVLGPGITWKGSLSGSGGVRIEGVFEGEIALRGQIRMEDKVDIGVAENTAEAELEGLEANPPDQDSNLN